MVSTTSKLPPAVALRLAHTLREKAANPKAPDEHRRRWLEAADRYAQQAEEQTHK